MKLNRWYVVVLLVTLMTFSALLVGCGSGTATESTEAVVTTAGGTSTSAATETTGGSETTAASGSTEAVRIGGAYPLTGAWAEGGNNCKQGMELAIEDINAAGGIQALGGAKMEVSFKDTTSTDPAEAASAVKGLIENENVCALVGAYVSALSLTASTEAERGKISMITQSYVDDLTKRGYKYLFQIPPISSVLGKAAIDYLAAITKATGGVASIVFATNNDANSIKSIEAAKAQAAAVGLKVADTITYPVGISDAMPIISKIKSADAAVIVMAGTLPDEILLIKGLRGVGVTTPILGLGGGGILGTSFPASLGENANAVMSISAWNWDLPYQGLADVSKAYATRYNVPFMPQEAGESYIAVWALKGAIEIAKSADPEAIREALATMELTTGPGAMMVGNKLAFDELGRNKYAVPLMIEYQGGLPRTVWPADVQTAQPSLSK